MMRVAAAAFQLTEPNHFDAWLAAVAHTLKTAQSMAVELLVFPEYMSLALEEHPQHSSWLKETFIPYFQTWVDDHNMTVFAGTHKYEGRNCGFVFGPRQKLLIQEKNNLIPSEPDMARGRSLQIFDAGRENIKTCALICYDSEFPELAREAVRQGAELVLLPSWTERRDGFNRVRYSAFARAIENQVYVVHAPLVGSMSPWGVDESATGSAAILAPCDSMISESGVLAETAFDEAGLAVYDLDFDLLRSVRESGSVRTYRDFMTYYAN